MVAVNIVGAKFVARAQSLIVTGVLAVFAVFIVVTITDLDLDLLAFSGYPSFSKIVASVALTFFAYLGFNVITFTAGDLRDPAHDLPRAMYGALGITSLTYVLIALGVFGTLTVAEVVGVRRDRDRRGRAAGARRRGLHDHGRSRRCSRRPARRTPRSTRRRTSPGCSRSSSSSRRSSDPGSRLGPEVGLLITGGVVLVVANLVDLSAIASVGSAVALMIFLLVGAAGYRRRHDTESNVVIVCLAIAVTAIVLVFFAIDTLRNAPETFIAIIAIAALAVVLDSVWKHVRREPPSTAAAEPTPSAGA